MVIGLMAGLSLLPFSYLNTATGQMADIYRNEGDNPVRYDPNDPEYYNNLTKFSYILYYGGFTDEIASAILSAEPTLLVTNYYAMNDAMRSEFAKNNVSIIAYVPIHWTQRDLGSVLTEIDQLLDDGADGIFVDEAVTVSNDWELWYHYQIYDAVKDVDKENLVIINPGTTALSEDVMLVADIICFEHEWRAIENVDWMWKYPGWRYMGISSNEFVNVMGYHVDGQSARQDLEEARFLNIAYHYSADHYIWLPPWFDVYGGHPGSPHPVTPYVPLHIDVPERPDNYYPVVDTKTDEVGNDHDVVIVDEEPDNPEPENDTSTEPGNDPSIGNETTSQPEQPEQPEEEEHVPAEEQDSGNNDNSTNSNSTAGQSNATGTAQNSTNDQVLTTTEQHINMTNTTNNGQPEVAAMQPAAKGEPAFIDE